MEYKLKQTTNYPGLKLTCICGKCNPDIIIQEDSKEEFKKLMGWSEEEFENKTIKQK